MRLKNILKGLVEDTTLYKKYSERKREEAFWAKFDYEKELTQKYNGGIDMKIDPIKYGNYIRVAVHAIEKGLSFRNPKPGFGVPRILNLLEDLRCHYQLFGDKIFLAHCLSTISYYIEQYKNLENVLPVIQSYNKLVADTGVKVEPQPGTIRISSAEIDCIISKTPFEDFIRSRHSYRSFTDEPVAKEKLEEAFRLAQTTPTACNRQLQQVHVFRGDSKNDILEHQYGSRGFYEEIDTLLLVTVDMRGYFKNEIPQPYIDGGLYSMNLLYCLHSQGLGMIPLTCNNYFHDKRKFLLQYGVPENEDPILLIGVGNRRDVVEVNTSTRIPYSNYVNWSFYGE